MVKHTRRNRKTGGGWSSGPALSSEAYYVPEYKSSNDCYAQARPGSIQFNPNPELAQTQMAGGARNKKNVKKTRKLKKMRGSAKKSRKAKMSGGFGCSAKRNMRGGCGCAVKRNMRGSGCSMKSRKLKSRSRQGTCGYYGAKGGRYTIDTSQSIGGDGPNVAPIFSRFPCESARAMPLNPTLPSMLGNGPIPDVNVSGLKPAFIQKGGAPVSLAYAAPRAGFSFTPNIAQGSNLNPGQIPYNVVVPQQTTGTNVSCGKAIANINKA